MSFMTLDSLWELIIGVLSVATLCMLTSHYSYWLIAKLKPTSISADKHISKYFSWPKYCTMLSAVMGC